MPAMNRAIPEQGSCQCIQSNLDHASSMTIPEQGPDPIVMVSVMNAQTIVARGDPPRLMLTDPMSGPMMRLMRMGVIAPVPGRAPMMWTGAVARLMCPWPLRRPVCISVLGLGLGTVHCIRQGLLA